jgi:rhodanese-related sulfurtransferase
MHKRTAIIALISLVALTPFAIAQQKATQPERIAVPDLKKKLDSGEKFLLVDVREDSEIKDEGAIPGAVHIPMGELDQRMKDIPKDVEVVFYCAAGARAERAAQKFLQSGYQAGPFCGMRDWKKENQKTVANISRPPAGPIRPK